MNTQIFSRADYMDNKCSHHEYYSQFVTNGMKSIILQKYSKEQLTERYNQDKNLNNIPLIWWDSFENIFKNHIASINRKINGQSTWSSCTHTCALKAAAIEIINSFSGIV